jgi:hypothetical protein
MTELSMTRVKGVASCPGSGTQRPMGADHVDMSLGSWPS